MGPDARSRLGTRFSAQRPARQSISRGVIVASRRAYQTTRPVGAGDVSMGPYRSVRRTVRMASIDSLQATPSLASPLCTTHRLYAALRVPSQSWRRLRGLRVCSIVFGTRSRFEGDASVSASDGVGLGRGDHSVTRSGGCGRWCAWRRRGLPSTASGLPARAWIRPRSGRLPTSRGCRCWTVRIWCMQSDRFLVYSRKLMWVAHSSGTSGRVVTVHRTPVRPRSSSRRCNGSGAGSACRIGRGVVLLRSNDPDPDGPGC